MEDILASLAEVKTDMKRLNKSGKEAEIMYGLRVRNPKPDREIGLKQRTYQEHKSATNVVGKSRSAYFSQVKRFKEKKEEISEQVLLKPNFKQIRNKKVSASFASKRFNSAKKYSRIISPKKDERVILKPNLDYNKPHSSSAIIMPKKILVTRRNLSEFIKKCNENVDDTINESFIMSILETDDTEPGPGYFDPAFDFYEKKSWNQKETFGKGQRWSQDEVADNFVPVLPDFNVNKKSIHGVKIKKKTKKTKQQIAKRKEKELLELNKFYRDKNVPAILDEKLKQKVPTVIFEVPKKLDKKQKNIRLLVLVTTFFLTFYPIPR